MGGGRGIPSEGSIEVDEAAKGQQRLTVLDQSNQETSVALPVQPKWHQPHGHHAPRHLVLLLFSTRYTSSQKLVTVNAIQLPFF